MNLEELEKRVGVLRDVEEIKKMHRNYIFCLNNCLWDKMADYFAENAVAHLAPDEPRKGKEEIAILLRDVIGKRALNIRPKGGQILIQPIIDIGGETAKGHWLMSRFIYDPDAQGKPVPHLSRGRYDCEYVKVNGKWKFSYLRWRRPWPEQ